MKSFKTYQTRKMNLNRFLFRIGITPRTIGDCDGDCIVITFNKTIDQRLVDYLNIVKWIDYSIIDNQIYARFNEKAIQS